MDQLDLAEVLLRRYISAEDMITYYCLRVMLAEMLVTSVLDAWRNVEKRRENLIQGTPLYAIGDVSWQVIEICMHISTPFIIIIYHHHHHRYYHFHHHHCPCHHHHHHLIHRQHHRVRVI